ncbi:MAG: PEGA domain-containing protein [bacterium]|nr:PEGA domain-containing protein [bacterium]
MNIQPFRSAGAVQVIFYLFIALLLFSSCNKDNSILASSGDSVEVPKAVVYFSSFPSQAEVKLDNVVVGTTPCSIEDIPYGRHGVKLTLENYVSRKDEVIIMEPSVNLHFLLIKYMGSVQVTTTDPEHADIYLDDVLLGQTPITPTVIQPGTYIIQVICPEEYGNYYAITDTVAVEMRQEASFSYNMTKIPEIADSGAASLIEGSIITGESSTFSNISKVYCYVDLENYNQDDWHIKHVWYRDNTPILSEDWSGIYSTGSLDFHTASIEESGNLSQGSYRLEIFIKENDYAFLLNSISFTIE